MNTATEHGDLPATLLLDASVIDDPYPFYRRLVAEAPVWRVPGTDIVIVSSFDAVTEVVLTRLLARTGRFALDPDRPPTRVNSLVVRRFGTLPLVATRA